MANTIARQVLLNGTQLYVVKLTIIGDGSGEESAILVNNTTGDLGTNSKIMKIVSSVSGFHARLLFDATTDVFAWELTDSACNIIDFEKEGGLINNAGTGITGDILLTTVGLGAGDSGSILLVIRKS